MCFYCANEGDTITACRGQTVPVAEPGAGTRRGMADHGPGRNSLVRVQRTCRTGRWLAGNGWPGFYSGSAPKPSGTLSTGNRCKSAASLGTSSRFWSLGFRAWKAKRLMDGPDGGSSSSGRARVARTRWRLESSWQRPKNAIFTPNLIRRLEPLTLRG
jgi:hypothetical protein